MIFKILGVKIKMRVLKYIALIVIMCISSLSQAYKGNSTQYYKNKVIPKISVQLWSVKHELKKDFKGTLTQIANMGFDGVEFAGDFGPYQNDAKGLKSFLDGLGLQVSAAHVNLTAFNTENFEQSVAYYKVLKTDTLIVAWDEKPGMQKKLIV